MIGPVAVILAAGQGKRMKSDKPKVVHEVCGQSMIRHVVNAAFGVGVSDVVVIVGQGADQVKASLEGISNVHYATQDRQLGTGDAVKSARSALGDYTGAVMILVGDEPCLRSGPLALLLEKQKATKVACLMGTSIAPDPTGYGRILRDTTGRFLRIIEQKDCTPEQAAIKEVNPSCYVFMAPLLWEALEEVVPANAQGEFYLTDAPEILQKKGHEVQALVTLHPDDILGINTRLHLAEAHTIMSRRILEKLMEEGVTVYDPRNTYVDSRAKIGADTVIYPFSVVDGDVTVGKNCRIGPFALIRHGTVLADNVEVGAFVDIVRSDIGEGTLVRHLAYLGDTEVGRHVTVGAGAITANFDGQHKQQTKIGDQVTIGAGSVLVAPTSIGSRSKVGAGAVVTPTRPVPPDTTVVGVPAQPIAKSKENDGRPVDPRQPPR
ncbi:MAG: UDP-N-acetylglucosamine pyrophosphorylase [Planctomycetota bacterium]|nr:MAG: UDP-N-acetylglucosamine pyrophosphorylase [Planctomycetota bacterium]